MNEPILTNKAEEALHEFESLENFHPSLDWNEKLMNKLQAQRSKSSFTPLNKFTAVIGVVVLLNVSLVLASILGNDQSDRENNLKVISIELLSSPVSHNP
jgi:hypothetical protein